MGTETGDRVGAWQQSSAQLTPKCPDLPPLTTATLHALTALLAFLGVGGSPLSDFAQAAQRWKKIPDRTKAAQALRLGDLKRLSDVVDHACKLGGYVIVTDDLVKKRNTVLAMLRVHFWLDLIRSRTPGFPETGMALPATDQEEATNRRLRAMELMLRAAINESYVDREALIERLRDLRPKEVDKWLRAADGQDILSGIEFQPLIELFVHEIEFPERYARLYEGTPFLKLFPDKRVTLRNFLEDARELRNRLAHHKPITPNQSALLALYFEEVIEPLAQAHAMGLLKADPRGLENDGNGMPAWLDLLHARAAQSELDSAFLKETTGRIKQDTTAILKRTGLVVALSLLIAAGVGATLLMTGGVSIGVSNLQVAVKSVKQEVSADPQKELANLGVPWTREAYFMALVQGDIREARLFAAAGMPLQDPDYAVCQLVQRKSPNFDAILDIIVAAGLNVKIPHQNCQNLREPPESLLTGAVRAANGPAIDSLLARGVRVTRASFTAFEGMNPSDFTTERPAAFTAKYRPLLEAHMSQQAPLPPLDELRARGFDTGSDGVGAAITQHDVEALRLFATLKIPISPEATFENLCGMVDSYGDDLADMLAVLKMMSFDINRPSRACSASAQPALTLLTLAVKSRNDQQTKALLDLGANPTRETIEALQYPFGRIDGRRPDPAYPVKWQPLLEQLMSRRSAAATPVAALSSTPAFDVSHDVAASTSTPVAAQSVPVPDLALSKAQARALAFTDMYLAQWSAPNEQAMTSMASSYATRVEYFGKATTRSDLLIDKLRFASRWPIRSYTTRPGSVVLVCEENGTVCTINSVVEWDCRSPKRNARSAGVSDFVIKVSWGSDGAKIISENGTVVRRTSTQ